MPPGSATLGAMRKLLIVAVAVLVACFAIRWVAGALASDEDRIRGRLDGMAEAFGESRLGPIADGIARDFSDRHSGHDRALILDLLRGLFVTHATGPFPYRVELEDVEVTLDPEESKERLADVRLRARFTEVGETPGEVWAVDIEARLVERDGWQIQSSSHISAAGDWRGFH